MKTYIGIDNGVTGTIGVLREKYPPLIGRIPVFSEMDYNKGKKKNITRLHFGKFCFLLEQRKQYGSLFLLLERPFKNPVGFDASISAARCFEAELIAIETLQIPFSICTPQEWQKVFLPGGLRKSKDIKSASLEAGIRLFPAQKDVLTMFGDADSLLIAEYARRRGL